MNSLKLISILLFCISLVSCDLFSSKDVIPKTITDIDPSFENFLVSNKIDKDGQVNGKLAYMDVKDIDSLFITTPVKNGKEEFVTSLKGIEYFTNIKKLYIIQSKISKLDLSKNIKLEVLKSTWNMNLDEINLLKNINLSLLRISGGNFKELNVSNLENLITLSINEVSLNYLNLEKNLKLKELYSFKTPITTFSFGKNINLETLSLDGVKIKSIDLREFINLKYVGISSSVGFDFEGNDLSKNKNLIAVGLSELNTKQLDISQNKELVILNLYASNLTSINISSNTKLKSLLINGSNIKQIDLSKNTNLIDISLKISQLETLNVDFCTNLDILFFTNSKVKTLNLTKNLKLTSFYGLDNFELKNICISPNATIKYFSKDSYTICSNKCS